MAVRGGKREIGRQRHYPHRPHHQRQRRKSNLHDVGDPDAAVDGVEVDNSGCWAAPNAEKHPAMVTHLLPFFHISSFPFPEEEEEENEVPDGAIPWTRRVRPEDSLWFSFSSSDSDAGEPLVERHTWGSFGVPVSPSQYVYKEHVAHLGCSWFCVARFIEVEPWQPHGCCSCCRHLGYDQHAFSETVCDG